MAHAKKASDHITQKGRYRVKGYTGYDWDYRYSTQAKTRQVLERDTWERIEEWYEEEQLRPNDNLVEVDNRITT